MTQNAAKNVKLTFLRRIDARISLSIGRTEDRSYFGHRFFNESFELLWGSIRGLAGSSCIRQERFKYILQLGPCKLWSFLRLTSIVHYEMKQGTWHLYIVSQFWHQPGLGIDWKVLVLDCGRWPIIALWVSFANSIFPVFFYCHSPCSGDCMSILDCPSFTILWWNQHSCVWFVVGDYEGYNVLWSTLLRH